MSNPDETDLEFSDPPVQGVEKGECEEIMEEILNNYDTDRNSNKICREFVREISQPELAPTLNAAPGFVKIWDLKNTMLLNGKECQPESIRLKILSYLDHSSLLRFRLACKATNRAISELPAFLDHSVFLYLCEDAHYRFCESTVRWKAIRLRYWPSYIDLPRGKVLDTLLFWEEKGFDMEEIVFEFHGGNPFTRRMLMDILPIPSNLKRLSLYCNMSGITMWTESEKQKLGKAMSKLVAFEVNGLNNFKVTELLENQMLNLHIIASYIPKNQLTTFRMDDGCQDRPLFINMMNDFLIEIIRQHASSLQTFSCTNGTIPSEAMLEICSYDDLKLSSLSIDLFQTCHYFEKAEAGVLPTGLQQVQAWRAFIKLLHRSINLRHLSIYLHRYNKKIGKKLFPQFIQETLESLELYTNVFESEDSLHILSKLKSLRHLSLTEATTTEAYGLRSTSLLVEDARKCFLAILPTTLESLFLISFKEFGPMCLVVIMQRLPNLTVLKLHECEKMLTDASVQTLFQYGKKLTKLYLVPANNVSDEGFSGKYNLGSLSGLIELAITHSKMTNFSLRKEFAFPQLETLDISHTNRISARAVAEILPKLQNLYALQVRGMDIPQGIAKKITAKFTSLGVYAGPQVEASAADNAEYYEYYNRWNYSAHISRFDECNVLNEVLRNHQNNSTLTSTSESDVPEPELPSSSSPLQKKPSLPSLRAPVDRRMRLSEEADRIVELLNKLQAERRDAISELEHRQQEQVRMEGVLRDLIYPPNEDPEQDSRLNMEADDSSSSRLTVDADEKLEPETESIHHDIPNPIDIGAGDVPNESLTLNGSKNEDGKSTSKEEPEPDGCVKN